MQLRAERRRSGGGAAQVSGHVVLFTASLCSWSSLHSDASGGVPVLAGQDRDDANAGRENGT